MARVRFVCFLVTLVLPCARNASAANELCGQTITQNLTLTADQACTGHGLVVGADGVTIDLAGFTISGDGGVTDWGIFVDNHAKVTVKNGTVRHFGEGIRASGTLKLSQVTSRDNTGEGADLFLDFFAIDHCTFLNNGARGMYIATNGPTHGGKLTSSAFVGNASHGLQHEIFSKATVANVLASTNGGWGMLISATKTNVASNVVAGNAMGGVLIQAASGGIKLTKSSITGNDGDGVRFNVASSNPLYGVNVVVGNYIAGNTGNGVNVTGGSDGDTITKNRLIGNGGAGVLVSANSDDTLVKGNTAIGNGGDGFATDNASTIFKKNAANANGQAFTTVAGVVDGGGNTARANRGTCAAPIVCPAPFKSKSGTTTPFCGMHVASSITLDADTALCVMTGGLIVDADDITINLNGHRLQGDRSDGPVGIEVGAHTGVTITNGLVRGFGVGIHLADGGDALKLVNVEVRDSLNDGAAIDGGAVRIDRSVFVQNSGNGATFGQFAAPTVTASFFVGNGGDGIRSSAPTGLFANSTTVGNFAHGADLGTVFGGTATFQRGVAATNRMSGVHVGGDYAATIATNEIIGNLQDGILVDASGHPIVAVGNVVAGNGGSGINLTAHSDPVTIAKNVTAGNGGDGVVVSALPALVSLVQNRSLGNMLDGFDNADLATTFTKNFAAGNAADGISTIAGVTDGGGNVGRDNAGAVQCAPPIACP